MTDIVKCPHCYDKYYGGLPRRMLGWIDNDDPLTFGMSRRDKARICTICTKAEALADMQTQLSDKMARTVVGNDHQEAMRLPAGGTFGIVMKFQTGGMVEWYEGWEVAYGETSKTSSE